jgi:CubicO group peptidase (beta-lactamase class C family)
MNSANNARHDSRATLLRVAVTLAFLIAASSVTASPAATAAIQPQAVEQIDASTRARIDAIAAAVLEQTGVPSASVAIIQQGKVVYTHAYGNARLQPHVPATPSMRYSIGSISKQFTAAAVLLLQEEGKLRLDDTVSQYLPGLTRGEDVTIRQLLSHTSGYQDYWPEDYVMTPMLAFVTAQQIIDQWGKKPLDFDPGAQWQYSNTNYVIAGQIVEKVAGMPLFDFLVARIFRPLGMRSVWNSDEGRLTTADATAYYRHALGPLRVAPKEGRGWMFAAGELAMTAGDLALWDASVMAQTVMKPESYREMATEVKLTDGKGTHYGLGVEVLNLHGHPALEHSGEVSGFVADNLVLVDDKAAVAVLTNLDASAAASRIAQLVAPVLIGTSTANPAEQQALALFRSLQQGKIDRTLLAPNLSDYFTAEALDDFRSSLAPLGEPLSIQQRGEQLRGGMTFRSFTFVFARRRLSLTTYTYPDGKLEQYLIAPGQ